MVEEENEGWGSDTKSPLAARGLMSNATGREQDISFLIHIATPTATFTVMTFCWAEPQPMLSASFPTPSTLSLQKRVEINISTPWLACSQGLPTNQVLPIRRPQPGVSGGSEVKTIFLLYLFSLQTRKIMNVEDWGSQEKVTLTSPLQSLGMTQLPATGLCSLPSHHTRRPGFPQAENDLL